MITPVCNFDQSDLCADDVMLLDTFTTVFVWIGDAANEGERTDVSALIRSTMLRSMLEPRRQFDLFPCCGDSSDRLLLRANEVRWREKVCFFSP